MDLFSELCRILQRIDDDETSIFTLFLSTAGNSRLLSPKIKSDPSSRVINEVLRPFYPITEISFDCLAHPAEESTVSLNEVVQMNWIAHLGSVGPCTCTPRPFCTPCKVVLMWSRFGSYFDGLRVEGRENDTLLFAKQKFLDGMNSLDEADSLGSLACLALTIWPRIQRG